MALLRRDEVVEAGSTTVQLHGSEVLYTADRAGLGGRGSGVGRQTVCEGVAAADWLYEAGKGISVTASGLATSRRVHSNVA